MLINVYDINDSKDKLFYWYWKILNNYYNFLLYYSYLKKIEGMKGKERKGK